MEVVIGVVVVSMRCKRVSWPVRTESGGEKRASRLSTRPERVRGYSTLSFLFGMEQEAPLGRLSLVVSSPGILIALQYNLSTHYSSYC